MEKKQGIYPMMLKVDVQSVKNVAPAAVVDVLAEIPVMLMLVKIANNTHGWFPVNKNILSR